MTFILNNLELVKTLLVQHVQMTGVTLVIALPVAVLIGVLIDQLRWLNTPVMGILSTLYTIPSLALIIVLVPVFGLNARSVIVAMILYVQVILVRHVTVGLQSIDPAVIEAAKGMGMNHWQLWWQVQVPLMLPIVLAGVRLATIVSIAIATIGAKFGAGGLGRLLFDGIAQTGRYDKIWAGSLAVGGLALAINGLLMVLEWLAQPGRLGGLGIPGFLLPGVRRAPSHPPSS